MNEFIEQLHKDLIEKAKESMDGHYAMIEPIIIDWRHIESALKESYTKGVDDAKKWQTEKPNKPCLFLHRYDNKDKFPSLHHAIYDGDELVVTDTEYNFSDTMENFADGEFFIIEQLKEQHNELNKTRS